MEIILCRKMTLLRKSSIKNKIANENRKDGKTMALLGSISLNDVKYFFFSGPVDYNLKILIYKNKRMNVSAVDLLDKHPYQIDALVLCSLYVKFLPDQEARNLL